MDVEFLKQLEEQISNVGTQECWQREIAGRLIWFSPIPLLSQSKVNETLSNAEALGANIFLETKRLTVAHATVGIDKIDLRPYRFAGPVFPSVDPRKKEAVNVDLPTYIYNKMPAWGWEFIERAFDVFVDLMESHKRDSLKNVQFENAKDPVSELAELEARAGELRMQLGMPLLKEIREDEDEEPVRPIRSDEVQPVDGSSEPSLGGPPVMNFDPFSPPQHVRQAPPAPAPPPVQAAGPPPPQALPDPVFTVPIPLPPTPPARAPAVVPHSQARQSSKTPAERGFGKEGSSPERPFQAIPSVPSEVVEAPAARVHTNPPQVDRIVGNVNPRFRPTGR